jgi:hypothetical protein
MEAFGSTYSVFAFPPILILTTGAFPGIVLFPHDLLEY